MRMWGVDPKTMCRQHLLGEHVEMHMFVGAIKKNKSLTGFLQGLVDTRLIQRRHDELADEMTRRGFNHRSPMAYMDHVGKGQIDTVANRHELSSRCLACKVMQG